MNSVLNFAVSELKKYWEMITSEKSPAITLSHDYIGDRFHEHFVIEVNEGKGKIYGDNPRSLLLGVYHFLREVGCAFIMPTPLGEKIPTKKAEEITVNIDFTPSSRHRGITVEGSCSVEHVLALVDWAAKNGFNSYFIQFRTGYTFFERWYDHNFNPYLDKEVFNDQIAEEINVKIKDAMAERGLLLHAVGHGWTCEPLGVPSRGWDEIKEIPEQYKDYFALINGERGYFKGVPLNTNLCYSNPAVRKIMADDIVKYAKENGNVDVLHIWLGDNYNNYCECENCKKKTPSDWYVTLLNEVDAALTKEGLNTKLVFLIYFELLFAPKTEKFNNPDRFILMFAPITRTYDKSWAGELDRARKITPPELTVNDFKPPVDVAENISHLLAWQKMFKGDSFVFDYPLMWDCCKEYGGITLAKTIYGDVRSMDEINLNGYVSCQIQRIFFPTGFCMYVMGQSLYFKDKTYDEMKEEYFSAAFEEYKDRVYAILEEVSSWKVYAYMKNEIPFNDKAMHDEMPAIKAKIAEFTKEVEGMLKECKSFFVLRNLRLVGILTTFLAKVAQIIEVKTVENPDYDKAAELLKELQLWIFTIEPSVEQFMDCSYFYTHVDEMSTRK